eukprot:m.104374 g.104374  ORF g.104374 m.104374 type:complete len:386 (+) comp15239_c0_seq2:166-1323(+)
MEGRYYSKYTRAEAESHLLKRGLDPGDYVVRNATKCNGKYVVSHVVALRDTTRGQVKSVNHTMVWAARGGFFVSNVRHIFNNMNELLEFHSRTPFPKTPTPLSRSVVHAMRIPSATIPLSANPMYKPTSALQKKQQPSSSKVGAILPGHRAAPKQRHKQSTPSHPVPKQLPSRQQAAYDVVLPATTPQKPPDLPSTPSPGSIPPPTQVKPEAYEPVDNLRESARQAYEVMRTKPAASQDDTHQPMYATVDEPVETTQGYTPSQEFAQSAQQAYDHVKQQRQSTNDDEYSTLGPPRSTAPKQSEEEYADPRSDGIQARKQARSQYCEVDVPRDAPTLPPKTHLSGFQDATWTHEGEDPKRKDYEHLDELDLDALVDLLVVEDDTDF